MANDYDLGQHRYGTVPSSQKVPLNNTRLERRSATGFFSGCFWLVEFQVNFISLYISKLNFFIRVCNIFIVRSFFHLPKKKNHLSSHHVEIDTANIFFKFSCSLCSLYSELTPHVKVFSVALTAGIIS